MSRRMHASRPSSTFLGFSASASATPASSPRASSADLMCWQSAVFFTRRTTADCSLESFSPLHSSVAAPPGLFLSGGLMHICHVYFAQLRSCTVQAPVVVFLARCCCTYILLFFYSDFEAFPLTSIGWFFFFF